MLPKLLALLHTLKDNPKLMMRYGFIFLGALLGLFLMSVGLSFLYKLLADLRLRRNSVLMEILPKETTDMKETEKLIKNIHSMLLNTKWRAVLYGQPYMSFEIVGSERLIKFYIWVPKDMKDRLVDRIYSAYPEIAIREKEDYLPDRLDKNIHSHGAEMALGYNHMLKIRTKSDSDILGSIISGMKDLGHNEICVAQILIKPLDNKWQIEGRKVLAQFEKDGIRPDRKGKSSGGFGRALSNILNSILGEVDRELKTVGIDMELSDGVSSPGSRKTKLDRKEITVGSEKVLESGFETVIRVTSIGSYKKGNKIRVKGVTAAFNELDQDNRFKRDYILNQPLLFRQLKKRRMHFEDKKNILTTSELANFFLRLPGSELIDAFPDIESLQIKEFAPPKSVETKDNIIAKNTYRGNDTLIGLRDRDLVRHIVVQGRTGSGKSEFIKTLFLDNIRNGRGAMILEPHGKLADELLEIIPEDRRKDVVYFDLFDAFPPAFNFCKVQKRSDVDYEDLLEKTVDESVEIFKRAFSDVWSGKNEFYITNAIKTIIEMQEGSMPDMPRLFTDKKFREYAIKKIKDPQLKSFWKNEFRENERGQISAGTESTVNSVLYKFGKFLNSKKLLRAVGQEDCIDFKDILDNNKIVIFRLSKDNMSEDRINFIGGIALKLLIVSAFARDKRMWGTPFLVIIDEAQNFINESIKTVFYELRKYGISLIMMHQALEQMNKVSGLVDAIYGSVGTMITFTVGQPDAPFFEKIYGPRVDARDLMKLPSRFGYCKLLVNGETSDTFNIYSLDRPEVDKATAVESAEEIKKNNRKNRLHFEEIDNMLANRILNYDELEEDSSDIEVTFKQKIDRDSDDILFDFEVKEKLEDGGQERENEVDETRLDVDVKDEGDKIKDIDEAAMMWELAEANEKKRR